MIKIYTERQIKYAAYLYEFYNGNMSCLEHYQQLHHLCEVVEIALQKMMMVRWLRSRRRKYVSTSLIVVCYMSMMLTKWII